MSLLGLTSIVTLQRKNKEINSFVEQLTTLWYNVGYQSVKEVNIMEMEHINDDTILIRIADADLQERGLTMMDLFSNPQGVETFFHSILKEFEIEDQFQESEAVTFQVMPNENGLDVYIVKNIEKNVEAMLESEPLKRLFEDFKSKRRNQTRKKRSPRETEEEVAEEEEEFSSTLLQETVVFETIEDFFLLAKNYPFVAEFAELYQFNDFYFLTIQNTVGDIPAQRMTLFEYARPTWVTKAVLSEYGQVVMPHNAFETAQDYFK